MGGVVEIDEDPSAGPGFHINQVLGVRIAMDRPGAQRRGYSMRVSASRRRSAWSVSQACWSAVSADASRVVSSCKAFRRRTSGW